MDQFSSTLSKQDPGHALPRGLRAAQPRQDHEASGVAQARRERRRTGANAYSKQKAARRRLFNSYLVMADQAAIKAGFDFRR